MCPCKCGGSLQGVFISCIGCALERMSSVQPLLSILPGFKAQRTTQYPYEDLYSLSEAIQEEYWTRLSRYACRIRHLNCSAAPKMDEFMLIFLLPHLKNKPLLPCLHSLTFPCSPVLLMLISPSLREVDIPGLGSQGTSSFLRVLLDSAPLLEKFSSLTTIKELSLDAWKTLRQFHNLRTLRLGSYESKNPFTFDTDSFGEVFSFRKMVELDLSFDNLDLSKSSLGSPFPQSFSLKVLKIRASPLFVGDVLECISTAPLQTLQIAYRSPRDLSTSEESWPVSFSPLSQWSESLVHLELQDKSPHGFPRVVVNDLSLLQPLRSLKKLSTISIVMTSLTLDLSDDAWGEVATWWPEIQKLWIVGGREQGPRAGFSTLEAFALHSPKLSDLNLWLDLTAPSISPPVLSHGLQQLSVVTSRAGNPHRVARHLDCLFPSLAVISINEQSSSGRWEDIKEILRTCQMVRLDHEKRLLAS